MKSMRKMTALLLTVSLLLATFVFSAGAVGAQDLNGAVEQMLSAEGYASLSVAYQNALDIYNGLDDDEKREAAPLYQKILEAEAELEQISDKALEFIDLVATISDVAVGDKMGVIERAQNLAVDLTYPGVVKAKETLAELKATHTLLVENCLAFIDAVSYAEQFSTEEYIELKAAIAEAEKYKAYIDQAYPGVSGAYFSFTDIVSGIVTRERYTQSVVDKINKLLDAETYIERATIKNEIARLIKDENYLPDYEGLTEDLLLRMAEVEESLGVCVQIATRFMLMVDAVYTADNYRGALIACYPYMEGVDFTVDGAEAAKSSFDAMVEEYNEVANYCNSFMSGK